MTSLRARLLVVASLVLTAFMILTAAVLDGAFRESTTQAQHDKLEGLVYALLAAARTDSFGNLTVQSDQISDQRLLQATSGMQAALFDEQGSLAWTSTEFLEMPSPPIPGVGEWLFAKHENPSQFTLSYGLRWIDLADDPKRYTFAVVEDASSFNRQLDAYRRQLWLWLAATAAALLLIQYLVLRWGLAPLRKVVNEMAAVERGESSEIQTGYPDELQPLARGLNAMIRSERSQQTRYRHALGDLAHSLKTPLAVLRGISEDDELPKKLRRSVNDQVAIMQQITGYQLRKAATAGRRTLAEPISPLPIVRKITKAMSKVYAEKTVAFDIQVASDFRLRADNDDLFELLGNLIDNACKYGGDKVIVRFDHTDAHEFIIVEDNGPGFPEDAQELLERGVRADTQRPGQGIGLASVNEIVKAYEGNIRLGNSSLGGASVIVSIPL